MKTLKSTNVMTKLCNNEELLNVNGGGIKNLLKVDSATFKLWGSYPGGSVLVAWAIHRANNSTSTSNNTYATCVPY